MLLLLALYIGIMAVKELVPKKSAYILLAIAAVLCYSIIAVLGKEFMLLAIFLCFEIISYKKLSLF